MPQTNEDRIIDCKKLVQAGYNAIAAEYLTTRTDTSEDVLLLQELVRRLPRGAKVLDAGCGAGLPVTKILCEFFDVTGVDFAEAQIELARQLVPKATFICQDIVGLDPPDDSFDEPRQVRSVASAEVEAPFGEGPASAGWCLHG